MGGLATPNTYLELYHGAVLQVTKRNLPETFQDQMTEM